MNSAQRRICPYCQTSNPASHQHCLACGAPLPATTPAKATQPQPTAIRNPQMPQAAKQLNSTQLRQAAEKTDDMYFTVLNTYAIAWRTLAEAISIALVAFVLGLIGGSTGLHVWGLLAALCVGSSVGWARKNFYLTLAGAPLGLILGLALGAVLWATGGSPQLLLPCATLPALAAALLGSRPQGLYRRRNLWEKARPFLGAGGALACALPGMLLGWGLSALLQNI